MTSAELEQAAAKLVARTRAAQGLPPKVTDAVVLRRVAVLMRPELPARRAS